MTPRSGIYLNAIVVTTVDAEPQLNRSKSIASFGIAEV